MILQSMVQSFRVAGNSCTGACGLQSHGVKCAWCYSHSAVQTRGENTAFMGHLQAMPGQLAVASALTAPPLRAWSSQGSAPQDRWHQPGLFQELG